MEAAALYFRKSKLTVERCNGLRCSLTKNALPVGFILPRSFSHALTALSSSPRRGCVVDNPPFNRATCSTRAFGVHLVECHPAGLRHAQAMPEHQEQQAAVAHLVPAVLSRFHQSFNLARGEMLPVADLCQPPASVPRRSLPPCRTSRFSPFWRVYHFVESLACPMPRKPA